MAKLKIKGVEIIETFAEAFPMVGTRIIITAPTQKWALIAATTMTGFATSVIACGAEAGIERLVSRKTREFIDDFIGSRLGLPPEFADLPREGSFLIF